MDGLDPEARGGQSLLQEIAHIAIVIDYQNIFFHLADIPPRFIRHPAV
jgi:hypothetical protein